jgi:hypothetical protein
MAEGARPARRESPTTRIVAATLVGWALLAVVVTLPYALAAALPPPGRFFSGAFAFQDDFYQYLSFLEQAGRGVVLFRNKFDVAPQPPALLNLAWWVGGVLGAGAGGPVEGFRALGVLGIGLLLGGATLMLETAGLTGRRLAWGVGLVATGSGLGWLRLWQGTPAMEVGDVGLCLYPSWEILVSAHALVGTALLLLALAWHIRWREGRTSRWRWLVTATVLGLCRPFDLGLFLLIATAIAGPRLLHHASRRAALGQLAELSWLAPVLAYDLLIFGFHPAFAVYSHQNVVPTPPLSTLAWALLPAAPLAVLALLGPRRLPDHDELLRTLRAWALVELAFLLVPGGGFAMQFVSSLGAVVLLAAALGTPPSWLPALTLAASPTSLLLLWVSYHPPLAWFPPQAYEDAARELKEECRPGDVLLGPIDPSLVVAGLTPCHVVLGHRVLTPEFASRVEEVRRFYARDTPPLWRCGYLDAVRARFVLLPTPGTGWLSGGGWRRVRVFSNFELWDRREPLPPL